MTTPMHPLPEDPELHDALFMAMQARGLRLVEMDQIIYPDQGMTERLGLPDHSVVYLQVLGAGKGAVASGSYRHALSPVCSPFIGLRAVPGSPRCRVMDELAMKVSELPL